METALCWLARCSEAAEWTRRLSQSLSNQGFLKHHQQCTRKRFLKYLRKNKTYKRHTVTNNSATECLRVIKAFIKNKHMWWFRNNWQFKLFGASQDPFAPLLSAAHQTEISHAITLLWEVACNTASKIFRTYIPLKLNLWQLGILWPTTGL